MKIYILKTDIDNYRGCYLKKTLVDRKIFRKLNKGNELTLTPEIQLEYDKENTNPVGDICECYDFTAYFINNKCKTIFLGIPRFNMQFISINDDFILCNNLEVIDSLDKHKTKFKYFESDIFGVEQYFFKDYDYPPLFQVKLPNSLIIRDYLVTNDFVRIVNDNNLKGFLFEEVWDSEKD